MLVTDAWIMKGVPELFESDLQESLRARTECLMSFRELGPPDLCHIVKSSKQSSTIHGSYHFVLGTEATSPATFSAYINSLIYKMPNVSGKANPWRITEGTYCCFNAFSRVDVRVKVNMPGGAEVYYIDLKGNKHNIDENSTMWNETHCSAMLRAILHDDGEDALLGLHKLEPLPTVKAERKFLDVAAMLFGNGWQLGSDRLVQVPTLTKNHLVDGILKYFLDFGRPKDAAKFFESLKELTPEIGALLAVAYIAGDEELKAVNVLFETSKTEPLSYHSLLVQIDFLLSKERHQKALVLAKFAVTLAPTEFSVWEKLTRVYIALEDYENALLALNTCTMYSFVEKDAHRMPLSRRVYIPLKFDNLKTDVDFLNAPNHEGSVLETNDPAENQIHPEIQKLASRTLKGTFKAAYDLLVIIASKVGWDGLLKYRSKVFVMEEEYRAQRTIPNEPDSNVTSPEDEKEMAAGMENISLDDDNKSPVPKKDFSQVNGTRNSIDQPVNSRGVYNPRTNGSDTAFRHKRLCEKWLDNLFMVHYHDLRIYSALKRELEAFEEFEKKNPDSKEKNPHYKTGAEWEAYGDLCMRMGHMGDAKLGYETCLKQKISLNALQCLVSIYTEEDSLIAALENAVILVSLLDKAYEEIVYPSTLAVNLFKLIRKNGLTKVQNALVAMNVQPAVYRRVIKYFEYAELFRIAGCND